MGGRNDSERIGSYLSLILRITKSCCFRRYRAMRQPPGRLGFLSRARAACLVAAASVARRPLALAALAVFGVTLMLLLRAAPMRASVTVADGVRGRPWRALGPAPHSGAAPEFQHVTAFERRLAQEAGLSEAAAIACVNGNAQIESWLPETFVEALEEPRRFATARAARAAAAVRDGTLPDPTAWKATFPRFSPCPGMRRYGSDGDGGKWFCGLHAVTAPCVIYSLGSYGEIDFEAAMSADTPCDIYTYDCYNPPADNVRLPPRVTAVKTCLGDDGADTRFASLPTLMRRTGHTSLSALKMDIEGAEWKVIRSLYAVGVADWARSFSILPQEISLEVHLFNFPENEAASVSFARVDDSWQALLNLGYTIVSAEANPRCIGCHEYTLVRLPQACWPSPPVDPNLFA